MSCNEINCVQKLNIGLLQKDNKTMAGDIKEIKSNVKDINTKMDKIFEFILTSPQKFPLKTDFDNFKKETRQFQNSVNLKIAGVSGGFAVVIYIINKFL